MDFADSAANLGRALRSGSNEIEISYDLKASVLSVRAIGPVAWYAVGGLLLIAVAAIIAAPGAAAFTGGFGAVGAAGGAMTAVGALSAMVGATTARFLLSVALAARDPSAVSRLRDDFTAVERSGRLFLIRQAGA